MLQLRTNSQPTPSFVRFKISTYLCHRNLTSDRLGHLTVHCPVSRALQESININKGMKNNIKILLVIIIWIGLCVWALMSSGCQTTHTETFHGDKDSVNYFRNGNIEWRWKK